MSNVHINISSKWFIIIISWRILAWKILNIMLWYYKIIDIKSNPMFYVLMHRDISYNQLCSQLTQFLWTMSSFLWHCVDYVIISVTLCGFCHNFCDIVWIGSHYFCEMNCHNFWHCLNSDVIISATLCE